MFYPTKPVQTRDGRKARIIATDASGNLPIVSLVTWRDGTEHAQHVGSDGLAYRGEKCGDDLINIPERHERWINIYLDNALSFKYNTKAEADAGANSSRIACIKITWTDGEGLE